jgi:RNA polymerase sigma-70 factor, ECF subfamily
VIAAGRGRPLPRAEIILGRRPYCGQTARSVRIQTDHGRDPNELALARRARRGDTAAFDALVGRFHRPVYRFCWRLVRSPDAEDLAQDTLVRAFVHFERFDPKRPVLPWLIAIARRLCLDLLRRRKVMANAETMLPTRPSAPPVPNPEGEASLREQLGRLERALDELDEGPREAIILFHIEGMSYRDIAAALEVPLGTVMTWLHRGRAKLKKAVEDAPIT